MITQDSIQALIWEAWILFRNFNVFRVLDLQHFFQVLCFPIPPHFGIEILEFVSEVSFSFSYLQILVLVRQVISVSNPLFAQILTCHELHLMQRLNQIVIIGFYIKHFNWESGIFKQDLPRKFYLFQEISHFLAIWVQFDCMKKFR